MKVNLVKYPHDGDWFLVKKLAYYTMGLEAKTPPDKFWKMNILEARHSPIRELSFIFELKQIPYWVSVHLVRHVHAVPYVQSQRNDRQDSYDRRKAPQDTPINMMWGMNAEELITIANKRLCGKASEETREVVKMMCKEVLKVCPEFANELVAMCERCGGVCHEIKPCEKRR